MKRFWITMLIIFALSVASPCWAQCPGGKCSAPRTPVRNVLKVAVAPLRILRAQPVRRVLRGVKARVERRRARRAARRGR
jgi:hypothetical protein